MFIVLMFILTWHQVFFFLYIRQTSSLLHFTFFYHAHQGNEKRVYEFIVRHFLACVSQVCIKDTQSGVCLPFLKKRMGPSLSCRVLEYAGN